LHINDEGCWLKCPYRSEDRLTIIDNQQLRSTHKISGVLGI
jgi:hypothetical protein